MGHYTSSELLTCLGKAAGGEERLIYKRLTTYSLYEEDPVRGALYAEIAEQPYHNLVHLTGHLLAKIAQKINQNIDGHYLLLDAPPPDQAPDLGVLVHFRKEGRYEPVWRAAPAMGRLQDEFEALAERVRLFCHPDVAPILEQLPLDDLLRAAIQDWKDVERQGPA
jgi:hypothetical protein